jgi:hypothetical protein
MDSFRSCVGALLRSRARQRTRTPAPTVSQPITVTPNTPNAAGQYFSPAARKPQPIARATIAARGLKSFILTASLASRGRFDVIDHVLFGVFARHCPSCESPWDDGGHRRWRTRARRRSWTRAPITSPRCWSRVGITSAASSRYRVFQSRTPRTLPASRHCRLPLVVGQREVAP